MGEFHSVFRTQMIKRELLAFSGQFHSFEHLSIQQMFAVLSLGPWEGIKETRQDPCLLAFYDPVQGLKASMGKYGEQRNPGQG